ncbi:MAG: hypothetical protein ACM3ML_32975 [Micromonosporaceae bacterium]
MTAHQLLRYVRSPDHEFHVPEFGFDSVDGPIAVALDGEVYGYRDHAQFTAAYRILQVYTPD